MQATPGLITHTGTGQVYSPYEALSIARFRVINPRTLVGFALINEWLTFFFLFFFVGEVGILCNALQKIKS